MQLDLNILLGLISIVVAIISLVIVMKINRERLINTNHELKSEMERIRFEIERKMYELNNKLVSTEDRWKDVNHLLVSSQNIQSKNIYSNINNDSIKHNSTFLKNAGVNIEESLQKDLVFFLTPFHKSQADVYNILSKVCMSFNMRLRRGDEEYLDRKAILSHVLENIVRSRLIIANIDGRNANVFYELGIAHALDKPTILICNDLDNVPFDLQQNYIIFYNSEEELAEKLKKALANILINN